MDRRACSCFGIRSTLTVSKVGDFDRHREVWCLAPGRGHRNRAKPNRPLMNLVDGGRCVGDRVQGQSPTATLESAQNLQEFFAAHLAPP